jgi:hypothetical protein
MNGARRGPRSVMRYESVAMENCEHNQLICRGRCRGYHSTAALGMALPSEEVAYVEVEARDGRPRAYEVRPT